MTTASVLRSRIRAAVRPSRAKALQRFFKTGPGEYGEGDVFIGLTVPEVRRFAREAESLGYPELQGFLRSKFHEERLLAVITLANLAQKADKAGDHRKLKQLYQLYLRNRKWVNNWDLVDSSAGHVVGRYLFGKDPGVLRRLARSKSVWDRRIAVLATFYFIRQGQFDLTLELAEQLLNDKHDLMHKAVGWMLREIGNQNRDVELAFLDRHAHEMPRTMLRYAIEKLTPAQRKRYMTAKKGT